MGVHHLSFKDVQTPVHQCNRHLFISVPKYVFWYLSRYHEQSAHDTKMKTLTYDTDMENVWRKGESSLTNGSPIAFSNRYERDVISPERPFITAVVTNTLDVVAEYVPDSHPDVILYESLKLHVFSRIVARPRGNVDSPHQMYVCGREGWEFRARTSSSAHCTQTCRLVCYHRFAPLCTSHVYAHIFAPTYT